MFETTVQDVIARARDLATEQGFSVCISVVDASGLQAGFLRMDDALPGAIEIAIKKARTAALFRTDSIEIGVGAQPGGPIYSLEFTNGGMISFGGGVVLHDTQGKVIGALGISGATVEADQVIAVGAARP
ncbi:heme-binding protein [Pseudomonas sp. SWRI74]|uniref:Heme-binding protein n=1 Tax=Pseudomonas azerbaijanoccidentalis TaxID=2842347 RepID=A0ABS6QWC9_9PSED|nr:heme-binding protein [Pseudomonas azerbaijanoccidentalis]MBV4523231.1 heme-binding protein [Pseudomonas azerbaijanoccidentalis]